jgi:hypothetical protein
VGAVGASTIESVPPKMIPELVDMLKVRNAFYLLTTTPLDLTFWCCCLLVYLSTFYLFVCLFVCLAFVFSRLGRKKSSTLPKTCCRISKSRYVYAHCTCSSRRIHRACFVLVISVRRRVLPTQLKQISTFTEVWNSQGTHSQHQVSLWAPSLQTSILSGNKARVCLGLYACKGFNNPLKSRAAGRYQLVEVTDNASIRMNRGKVLSAVLEKICPFPIKFTQVWHFARGAKSLHAWKPLAPEGYVALGMLTTGNENPPDVKLMRCIPKAWVLPSKQSPVKIWDDTGAGGGKPASMWIINSLGMVAIVAGHEPPTETYYDLSSGRFFLEGMQLPPAALSAVVGAK